MKPNSVNYEFILDLMVMASSLKLAEAVGRFIATESTQLSRNLQPKEVDCDWAIE